MLMQSLRKQKDSQNWVELLPSKSVVLTHLIFMVRVETQNSVKDWEDLAREM